MDWTHTPLPNSTQSSSGIDHPKVSLIFDWLLKCFLDFYSVNMEMVDNTNEGLTLMAIGDMDNDKHTDLVTVNSN